VGSREYFIQILFFSSLFIVIFKILTPSPIQIYIGNESIVLENAPKFFTYRDGFILSIFSFLLGICTFFLLTIDKRLDLLEKRRKEWKKISERLREDERRIYEIVLESDGIISQSEICRKSGFSRATVSRILDMLESKNLVERRRRGMGNIVVIK